MRPVSTLAALAAAVLVGAAWTAPVRAQAAGIPIRDLVSADQAVPVRLMGYGIVVGLAGTGDRASARGSQETVQSIANVLRRFGVQVPPDYLRTRNAAAVLVTAEVSPYLRSGGRFEVQVSSIGDARSLRGGVLWMTPLLADVGGASLASAQGALLLPLEQDPRTGWSSAWGGRGATETSARVPAGGLVEADLPRPPSPRPGAARLTLRDPDATTAERIAAAVNKELGDGSAHVEDPGAVTLAIKGGDAERSMQMARIAALRIDPARAARIIIEARTGSVVAGGDVTIGSGAVSIDGLALRIGAPAADTLRSRGQVDLPPGATVQQLVAALHAVQAPAGQIAAALDALRQAGAIAAEVVVR